MHLNDEQIQRLLHGELDARAKESASLHVAECGECARLLAEAKREEAAIFELLGRLDHPAPRVDAASFARRGGGLGSWGRRAAGVAIVVGLAGAAYAIPGSPLPAWVHQVAKRIAGADSTPPTSNQAPTEPVTSGVAVPVSPRFAIVFATEQSSGEAAISLVDGPNVAVRALGGTVTFTADANRLTIDNRDSKASYEIEIPRKAAFVEIYVGARRIVFKDGDALATDLMADARGRSLLPLTSVSPPKN